MTNSLIALLTIWTVVVPGAVVLLRLRGSERRAEVSVEEARVGNSTHSCQEGRWRRVAYTATHVNSRRTRERFSHRPGEASKRS